MRLTYSSLTDKQPLFVVVPHDRQEYEAWSADTADETSNVHVADMGDWEQPERNIWVNRLNRALCRPERPVILIAYGVSCLTLAWWAEFERPAVDSPVQQAFLVDPPDRVGGIDARVAQFGHWPERPFAFSASLVTSGESLGHRKAAHRALADMWGCAYVDAALCRSAMPGTMRSSMADARALTPPFGPRPNISVTLGG